MEAKRGSLHSCNVLNSSSLCGEFGPIVEVWLMFIVFLRIDMQADTSIRVGLHVRTCAMKLLRV